MERTALGIDVGGTKVAGIVMGERGTILRSEISATPADDVEATMGAIYDVADELARGIAPVGVGIGAAGLVDFRAGRLHWAPNLAWQELDLRALVEEHTGLPCVVDNDANTAAWGEFRFGAAKGYGYVLVITVGTGIGGGIVVDGVMYRGAHGFAAEIGHIVVEPGGPRCGCGNLGCWEQVASGQAVDRLARRIVQKDPGSLIGEIAGDEEPSGVHVTEAAMRGDPAALEAYAEIGGRLGEGIAGLVNVLDPDVVVVGGGAARVGEPLMGPARAAFRDAVEAPAHRPEVPLIPAVLGNDAGAIGAAALALEEAP